MGSSVWAGIKPMLGFKSFETAEHSIAGIEVIHMVRKGQVEYNHSSAFSEVELINAPEPKNIY
jgi:IS6 family transposase